MAIRKRFKVNTNAKVHRVGEILTIFFILLCFVITINGGRSVLRESPDALFGGVRVILFVFNPVYDIRVALNHLLHGIRHGVQLDFASKWIVKL